MKKIITLLVSVTMVASVFAQYGGGKDQRDNGYGNNGAGNSGYGNYAKGKDVGYNDGKFKDNSFFKDSYVFSPRDRDMQIADINWQYDHKIQMLKMRLFMPRFKKEQITCQLEEQRKDEIKAVFEKFNSRQNRYGDFGHGSRDNDQRRNW